MHHEMNRGCNCVGTLSVLQTTHSAFLLLSLFNPSLKPMTLMLNCFIKLFLNDS